jgi:hypothetical protein
MIYLLMKHYSCLLQRRHNAHGMASVISRTTLQICLKIGIDITRIKGKTFNYRLVIMNTPVTQQRSQCLIRSALIIYSVNITDCFTAKANYWHLLSWGEGHVVFKDRITKVG